MESTLIEKLKNEKQYAFYMLSEKEQECLEKVNDEGCVECLNSHGSWLNGRWAIQNGYIYRIKPDYQPEPEHIDLPIFKIIFYGEEWFGVEINGKEYPLHQIPSMPNFVDFRLGKTNDSPTIIIESVARTIRKGKTVYARFRK